MGTSTTTDSRVARLFGLQGDHWMRHADPWSVWTRFLALPLLALAAWSRVWIGWWAVLAGVVAGMAIVQCAKAWFIDRAVLLFEDMKARDPAYAAWEYPPPSAP